MSYVQKPTLIAVIGYMYPDREVSATDPESYATIAWEKGDVIPEVTLNADLLTYYKQLVTDKIRDEAHVQRKSKFNLVLGTEDEEQIRTYDEKYKEASAYLVHNESPTPIMSAETAQTGETVAALAPIVVAQYDSAYAVLRSMWGSIEGIRRASIAWTQTATVADLEAYQGPSVGVGDSYMWALVKNGEVIDIADTPSSVITSDKRHLSEYRWISVDVHTGPCSIGDAFLNGKFLGPIVVSGSPSFTPYYAYVERTAPRSSNSTYFYTYVELVTENLDEAPYRVGWAYNWSFNSTSGSFDALLEFVDNNDTCYSIFEHFQEPKDSGGQSLYTGTNQKLAVSSFKAMQLRGVNTFRLMYRSSQKKTIASMWDAKIEIMRVG